MYVVAGFSTFPIANYFAIILDRLRSDISLLAFNDAFATPRLVEMKAGLQIAGNPATPYGGNRDMIITIGSGSGAVFRPWLRLVCMANS